MKYIIDIDALKDCLEFVSFANVNGKPARFTKEEYDKFISALDEVAMMINNTSASLKLN